MHRRLCGICMLIQKEALEFSAAPGFRRCSLGTSTLRWRARFTSTSNQYSPCRLFLYFFTLCASQVLKVVQDSLLRYWVPYKKIHLDDKLLDWKGKDWARVPHVFYWFVWSDKFFISIWSSKLFYPQIFRIRKPKPHGLLSYVLADCFQYIFGIEPRFGDERVKMTPIYEVQPNVSLTPILN